MGDDKESSKMRIAGIRELRGDLKGILGSEEPILVTRHGKISGIYLPLFDPHRLPDDLRKEILRVLGDHLSKRLDAAGATEQDVNEDFEAHRRGRRRR